jgi:hypothetical protein
MPQNPGGSDLHIDRPLTNVSVAYFQDPNDFIADKVFPSLPVDKRSDIFWKYSKSDWRRTDAQRRAPGTESVGIGWSNQTDNFFCDVYAVHVDIDAQTRANADSNWNLDSDATRLITQHLLLNKDRQWANSYFKTGVWDVEKTGHAGSVGDPVNAADEFVQWDQAASDPLTDSTNWLTDFRLSVGRKANFMVMGTDVWKALKNHEAILDRIKYTQKGVLTEELVAEFLGIEKLYIGYASEGTGPQFNDGAAQDDATTYDWMLDTKGILFGYAPSRPGLLEPAAGYTFNWRGYGAGNKYGLTMSNFPDLKTRSDRIEGEAAYDMKVVSKDCGVFINDAVSTPGA